MVTQRKPQRIMNLLALLFALMLVTPAAACGNGVLATPEACDDGNTRNGDGCSSTCVVEDDCTCNAPVGAISTCDCDDDIFGNSDNWWWWLLALLIAGCICLACLAAAAYFLMNNNNDGGYGGWGPMYRSGGSSPLSPGAVAPGAPPIPLREFSGAPLVDDKPATIV